LRTKTTQKGGKKLTLELALELIWEFFSVEIGNCKGPSFAVSKQKAPFSALMFLISGDGGIEAPSKKMLAMILQRIVYFFPPVGGFNYMNFK